MSKPDILPAFKAATAKHHGQPKLIPTPGSPNRRFEFVSGGMTLTTVVRGLSEGGTLKMARANKKYVGIDQDFTTVVDTRETDDGYIATVYQIGMADFISHLNANLKYRLDRNPTLAPDAQVVIYFDHYDGKGASGIGSNLKSKAIWVEEVAINADGSLRDPEQPVAVNPAPIPQATSPAPKDLDAVLIKVKQMIADEIGVGPERIDVKITLTA